jgi:hypothetical protein
MNSKQLHTIPITHAQRWVLLNLSHAESEKVKGQESKAYRRFMRACGLTKIRETLRKHRDVGVNVAMVNSDEARIFELTEETIEYALKIADKVDRKPSDDDVVGDLFDLLEDAKAGRAVAYDENTPFYDAASDNWDPPPEEKDDPTVPGGDAEPPPVSVPPPPDQLPPPEPPRQDDRPEAQA